jgi:YD repeat-containing protein
VLVPLNLTGNLTRREISIWQIEQAPVGHFDSLSQGLGGWNLSIHHWYDSIGGVLYLGDGSRRSAKGPVITTVAGNGMFGGGVSDDGLPAIQAQVASPQGVAVGPDGSLYIADQQNDKVRWVDPNGIIHPFAGTGTQGPLGDNGPAILAQLHNPYGVAVGPDGSVYIADTGNNRVRRVTGGIITTVAGVLLGTPGTAAGGDNGPATQAHLYLPQGVAVGSDGSLYIADTGNNKVRRVDPGQIITTVAGVPPGTPGTASDGDGGLATQAKLSNPQGIAVDSDGNLYIADTGHNRVRRVDPSGIITAVAGTGQFNIGGDGFPAVDAQMKQPKGVAVVPGGTLYIADTGNNKVRQVTSNGIITTVAGSGSVGDKGDGGPATQAQMYQPRGIAVGSDGSLYIADAQNHRVRRVARSLPGLSLGDFLIAGANGAELYLFDSTGRHLQTINALTGAIRYQFFYDNAGRLHQVTDGDNNVTTINYDANGNFTIISPFGQQTTCTLGPDGYLANIAYPGVNP